MVEPDFDEIIKSVLFLSKFAVEFIYENASRLSKKWTPSALFLALSISNIARTPSELPPIPTIKISLNSLPFKNSCVSQMTLSPSCGKK